MKPVKILLKLLSFVAIAAILSKTAYAEYTEIKEYLESTRDHSENILINDALAKISDALWIESTISFNLENNSWGGNPISVFFCKKDGKLTQIKIDRMMLPSSDLFISSISTDFTLKKESDAILFQEMLYLFDQQNFSKGFYNKGKEWFFVRNEMFDNKEGFKVTTDENGKILAVEYSGKFETEIPETQGENEKTNIDKEETIDLMMQKFEGLIRNSAEDENPNQLATHDPILKLSEKDAQDIYAKASQMLKYRFEVMPMDSKEISSISNAKFYNGKLIIDHSTPEYQYETTEEVMIIESDGSFSRVVDPKALFTDHLFLSSLKKDVSLRQEKWSKRFELMLNEIAPGEAEKIGIIQEDDIIAFIREKRFDDKYAFIALLDSKGKIIAMDYDKFDENSIMRLRTKDPNFVVDYKFELVEPTKTKVTISASESVPVKITFDSKIANATSAWLLTQVNGKMAGMDVSTDGIKSPFTDEIPGSYLKEGKHLVEYILMPPGNDTEKAFAKIAIEVEVK